MKADLSWSMLFGAVLLISQLVVILNVSLEPTFWKIVFHAILHFAILFGGLYLFSLTDWISITIGCNFYLSSYQLSRSYASTQESEWSVVNISQHSLIFIKYEHFIINCGCCYQVQLLKHMHLIFIQFKSITINGSITHRNYACNFKIFWEC